MSNSVYLPPLGESVTEGTVTRWLKNVGDKVEVDEPLVEISTDKVDTEIPSPFSGVIAKILVNEDEVAEVGATLAVIADDANSFIDLPASDSPVVEAAIEEIVSDENVESSYEEVSSSDYVVLPPLGESVTEGTVTRWLKNVGDKVEVDEPLVEISTDKVDTEIPSPFSGVIAKILVNEDEVAEVGATLAVIASNISMAPVVSRSASEDVSSSGGFSEKTTLGSVDVAINRVFEAHKSPYVTPLVRKLAKEYNVDLGEVLGTGVGGRIRKEDVMKLVSFEVVASEPVSVVKSSSSSAINASVSKKAPTYQASPVHSKEFLPASSALSSGSSTSSLRGSTQKLSRRRQVIAKNMVNSLQVSAQLTTVVEVDVTRIAQLRNKAKNVFFEREGVKLSFLPFFAKAAVEALKTHPTINASLNTESTEAVYFDVENLGIAVDTESGLVVPVIKNAGSLNIAGIAKGISDLASRTRNNKISPDDLSGGTFTLTNTGSRGALFDTPIINQPQVAILGTGSVVKKPVVITNVDGSESIAVRSTVYLALSYDHRLVDGADAARFLSAVKARLEEGNFENDLGL